jgi:hypothetical protein
MNRLTKENVVRMGFRDPIHELGAMTNVIGTDNVQVPARELLLQAHPGLEEHVEPLNWMDAPEVEHLPACSQTTRNGRVRWNFNSMRQAHCRLAKTETFKVQRLGRSCYVESIRSSESGSFL